MNPPLTHAVFNTPIGDMHTLANSDGICLLEFYDRPELSKEIEQLKVYFKCAINYGENKYTTLLKKELVEYFKGELQQFTVPLIFNGTAFQKSVWKSLLEIPYGETRTYKQQSIILGDLKAIRAVASANGKNKMAIIIPCHRVIGSNGSLTGYAGGIDRKRYLLDLERKIAGPKDLFSL